MSGQRLDSLFSATSGDKMKAKKKSGSLSASNVSPEELSFKIRVLHISQVYLHMDLKVLATFQPSHSHRVPSIFS